MRRLDELDLQVIRVKQSDQFNAIVLLLLTLESPLFQVRILCLFLHLLLLKMLLNDGKLLHVPPQDCFLIEFDIKPGGFCINARVVDCDFLAPSTV